MGHNQVAWQSLEDVKAVKGKMVLIKFYVSHLMTLCRAYPARVYGDPKISQILHEIALEARG